MKTIVIASRKGGVGKTTTTRNIATSLDRRGYKVLLIDTDLQGGLTAWWNARQAETPQLLVVDYKQLGQAVKQAQQSGFDYLLIDTPPESNANVIETLSYADFVLIPLKASVDDLRAVTQTIQLVKQTNKSFAFVLNEIKPNANLTREVAEALSQYGPLAPSQPSRVIHIESAVEGKTAIDTRISSSASRDIDKLVDYVLVQLGGKDE